jgi:tartrate-resistant acid phosphatase type 5
MEPMKVEESPVIANKNDEKDIESQRLTTIYVDEVKHSSNKRGSILFRKDALLIGIILAAIIVAISGYYEFNHVKGMPPSNLQISPSLPSSVNFVSFGDWGRSGSDAQKSTAAGMSNVSITYKTAFTISVGDNFYENGVTSVDDPAFLDSFANIYDQSIGKVYAINGNHDYRGSLEAQINFRKDARWTMPSLNYTLKVDLPSGVGSICFIFLDTVPFLREYWDNPDTDLMRLQLLQSSTSAQLQWLELKLIEFQQSCVSTMVVGHHPAYTHGQHGNNQEVIDAFVPLFEKYKVDTYFAGHDHTLGYLTSSGLKNTDETQYIVTGGGSKLRHDSVQTPQTLWFHDINGFSLTSVNATHALHTIFSDKVEVLFQSLVQLRKSRL